MLAAALQVNGLSNLFWGWGREDDELYVRMKEAKMTIHYPEGISTGTNSFRHIHDKIKRPRDQKKFNNQKDVSSAPPPTPIPHLLILSPPPDLMPSPSRCLDVGIAKQE